jgi:hypothetical protein
LELKQKERHEEQLIESAALFKQIFQLAGFVMLIDVIKSADALSIDEYTRHLWSKQKTS